MQLPWYQDPSCLHSICPKLCGAHGSPSTFQKIQKDAFDKYIVLLGRISVNATYFGHILTKETGFKNNTVNLK